MKQPVPFFFLSLWTGTGETAKNLKYLLDIGVTHLLNTAENDVNVNPKRYTKEGISYKGFRCPDLPQAQCVELALRWQFCVHGSICHEIYF